MKRILGRTAVVGTALLAGAALAGCGGGGSSASSGSQAAADGSGTFAGASCMTSGAPVALAIGARSNNPTPSLTSFDSSLVTSAVKAQKQITVVRVDGGPQSVFDQAYTPTGANSGAQKASYDTYVNNLNEILAGTSNPATDIRAQAAQVNLIQALAVAAGDLQYAGGGNLIVVDSGLQTMAPLDFTTGLLADDPQTIASSLKAADELPNLKRLHVEFSGLGWTSSPQPALGVAYQNKVVQDWTAIAKAAGASCVAIDPAAPKYQSALSGLPPVSVVSLPKPVVPPKSCSTTDLSDANNVGFDYNSTTFRDPSGARVTLQKLANVIASTGESVTLTGATSSEGSDSYNHQLSLQRAQAVQAMLVRLGVPASRITTIGDGSHLPGQAQRQGLERTAADRSGNPEPEGGGEAERQQLLLVMQSVRYGQWRRLTDGYHGWRDGRKRIPARSPQVPSPGPVTTPHREVLIRLAQDAFAQEYLVHQRLTAETHRRIAASRAQLAAAGDSLTWAQSAEDMEARPLSAEQVTQRRLGEDHHPEQVIMQRRFRDQQRLIARARTEVARTRAQIAEIEAELADDVQEARQQHQVAVARVQRIHEYVHRRLAVYRRSLIRAHPDGSWANSALSLKEPTIPGWALPDAYLPDDVPPPAVQDKTEDDDFSLPDEPPVRIIHLRKDVTRFGSQPESETEDVAWERLASPLAAPWHFTIVKKGDRLDLRTRNYDHKPYVGGKPVSGTAMLTEGDYFDFAEDRYTMLDANRLQQAPIGKPSLVAADLHATSKSKVRLSGMSFMQEDRTLLAILGPSGAGKSSLFAALLGELPLESGQLFFAGLPMATHSQQIRGQLGFVPQQIELHMSLTVQATLRYGFGLRSPDRSKRDTAIKKALEVVKLEGREGQLLSTLSGGQLRRVSIALELLTNPPLLLLDEPTSGLDAHMDRLIMTFLREYAEKIEAGEPTKRHTVIVVTHATEHLPMAHQILVVVDDGRPAYFGPPKQIRKHFGFKTYADLMSMLMDDPRKWAARYQVGSSFKQARALAEKLAQRSASEVSTLARKLGGSRPRSPRDALAKLGVLVRRQVMLLGSRALTKNAKDRGPFDAVKNAVVVLLPLIIAAGSAAVASFVASSPGLGGLKPTGAGPTSLTLLSTLCILSGQALTYSDVVNELKIIEREYRAGVRAVSVLLSKWLVYAVVAIAQAGVITFVFCAIPNRQPIRSLFGGPELNLFVSLSALIVVAMTLGLLVSTVAGKLEHAVAMVTGISILQIALNGVTDNLSKGGPVTWLSELLPDRWGLAAAASSVDLRGIDSADVSPDAVWQHTDVQWVTDTGALCVLGTLFFALATWRLRSRLRLQTDRRRNKKRVTETVS